MILSNSRIKTFKACRRMYQLKYVEGLTPVVKSDALKVGSNYHKLIEELYNTGNLPASDGGWTKELAMAAAYAKYIYPKFKVTTTEKWVEYDLGNGDKLVGVIDAVCEDGTLVEHKTCGYPVTEAYEYGLQWDDQLLAYMLITGQRKMWYTVCRKPTIRQRSGESDKDFFDRMVYWYDDETDSKIRLIEVTRTDAEVEEFRHSLEVIKATMQEAEQQKNYYTNPCHCNAYGGRCEYSSVCLHYDPNQQYIDFVKI